MDVAIDRLVSEAGIALLLSMVINAYLFRELRRRDKRDQTNMDTILNALTSSAAALSSLKESISSLALASNNRN